jgi:hypothetical protein
MNGREEAIRRNATKNITPAVGSYGGGEDFGSPFGGGVGQPPGRTNEAAVPYGGPPSAYPPSGDPPSIGGGGGDTGSVSSGGSGSGSKGPAGMTLDQIRLFNLITDANIDILGTRGGIGNMRTKSMDSLSLTDEQQMEDLFKIEAKQLDTTPLNLQDKINNAIFGQDTAAGEFGLNKEGLGFITGSGTEYGIKPTFNEGNLGFNIGLTKPFNWGKAQGGPVGLMSLPQGYANGGEVIEGEDTMEELTPFGGTRERVMDQVEAFDNAPHHIEEPMIGMWGEKIPLTTARRVQKYMQGMDPVKRGLIEEMMQMFSMKKMMEQQQDQQQKGQYFGPQPNEYAI